MSLRLIFMGTPEFAVPTLLALVAHGHEIAAVYTRAAKPAGRGMKLQSSPVEQEARRLGIPVMTPTTLKTPEALAEFRARDADAAVVVAYGMILPQAISMRQSSAASICTPRSCRAGVARRRSTAPSWPAIKRLA
jgi:methionyl-tRNA formyltransferase